MKIKNLNEKNNELFLKEPIQFIIKSILLFSINFRLTNNQFDNHYLNKYYD